MPRMPPYIWTVRECEREHSVGTESSSQSVKARHWETQGRMGPHHVNVDVSNHKATMLCSELLHFLLFLGNQFCQSLFETTITM